MRDASDATLARVVETEKGYASARYVAQADGKEICRFVWGFLGLSVLSAELQIEFLPGAERRVSKAMAIVLGPRKILEDGASRASRWRSGGVVGAWNSSEIVTSSPIPNRSSMTSRRRVQCSPEAGTHSPTGHVRFLTTLVGAHCSSSSCASPLFECEPRATA